MVINVSFMSSVIAQFRVESCRTLSSSGGVRSNQGEERKKGAYPRELFNLRKVLLDTLWMLTGKIAVEL